MFRPFFHYLPLLSVPVLLSAGLTVASAAPLTCVPLATPLLVHGEGITERTGDIVFTCTGGTPGAAININLSLFLNVNITNRLTSAASGTLTGITLTADSGSGPQPVPSPATLSGLGTLIFNGANFTLSSTGSVTLRIAGLRGAATLLDFDPAKSMQVSIGINGSTTFALTNSQLGVGQPTHGLYVAFSGALICTQAGSPVPQNTASFASFIASGATFTSTRVTEGYASSFGPKSDLQNLNADTGTRILVQYSGFPASARIFVPTVVAGSDATQPTAGGDLGLTVSGGKYTPGSSSSLLLSLVPYADANGAGGGPIYVPGLSGSGTVNLDSMSEVTLTNGAGVAIYEVVDANSSIQESAQFPTFLSIAPSGNGTSTTTSENVSLGPISAVQIATATDPIPRFQQITPPADCSIVGDCNAQYFPSLVVPESTLSYTAQAGGVGQTNYVQVQNPGGGLLQWTSTVSYSNGSSWLNVSPTQGQNDGTIRVDAIPGKLAPGTYQATLTIDAGPLAGTHTVAISFVVAAPAVQPPSVLSAVNAATFAAGPLTPGSIATITGSQFSGKNISATFNGLPGQVLFSNATQINLIVPAGLAGKTSAQVVVTVDGTASAPLTVNLAAFGPGIFTNGIANQDNSVNSAKQPATAGSVIQIYATGLSGSGVITANVGTEVVTQPYYAGPAPGIPGVQQIDLILPADLTEDSVNVSVCGGPTVAQVVCSPVVAVAISQ